MVDKLFSVPIQALGAVVGQLEPQLLVALDLALRGWMDLPRASPRRQERSQPASVGLRHRSRHSPAGSRR
jgi:hypothetical protein